MIYIKDYGIKLTINIIIRNDSKKGDSRTVPGNPPLLNKCEQLSIQVAPLKEELFNIPIITKQLIWNHVIG